MSNPPAGWYPDPTGQPNTIRWWNGMKWTNKTDSSDAQPEPVEEPDSEASTTDQPSLAEVGEEIAGQPETERPEEGPSDGPQLTAAERARATWTGPQGDVPSWHWTRREPDPEQQVEREPAEDAEPIEDPGRSSWTLRIAEEPVEPAPSAGSETAEAPTGTTQGAPARTEQTGSWQGAGASSGPWQSSSASTSGTSAGAEEPSDPAAAWWAASQAHPEQSTEQAGQAGESWSSVSWTQQPTTVPQPSSETTAQPAEPQPDATPQAGDDDATGDLPIVDIEAAQATWQSTGPTQWELAAQQQQTAPADASTQQTTGWQAAPHGAQAGGWQGGQPASGWQGAAATQQWQGVGGGGSPSTKGKTKKPAAGGGMFSGAKGPLFIGGPIALILLILAAVLALTNDDPKDPSGANTPTSQPTTQSTGTKQGQSKDPKLHEGDRISSDAISFPRRRPPWSDRKRLVPQLQNSSGQYFVLQEKFDGKRDWYASIFVGALGTGSGFDGNPQQTANTLAVQVRESLYGDVPATFRGVANGALKRSGKNGWFYQQLVTVNHARLTAKVLTLTVAVFDLGDGSAVAYISDIPTTRPDLRAAEGQAYKGITVG